MDYSIIRRIVEEEVVRHRSAAKANARIRRPVVAEAMIVSAWRRGSKSIDVPPAAIITPAAAERARRLGVAIQESLHPGGAAAEESALIEAVMAAVLAAISDKPTVADRRAPTRSLLTAEDVERMRHQAKSISVDRKTKVTPLARDQAEKYGIKLRREPER